MNPKKAAIRKPIRLLEKVNRHPLSCLQEVYKTFHLSDIKSELEEWFHVGLSNDNSAYEEGQQRSNLIRFNGELQILSEALHLVNKAHQPKGVKDWMEGLPPEIKNEIQQYNQPTKLSHEEMINPMQVVKQFCKAFTREYAIREMWDWLDAVITYEGEYPKAVYKGNIIIFYECLLCLIESAFVLNNK